MRVELELAVDVTVQDYGGIPEGVSCSQSQVRLVLRDMAGKHVWDYTLLHGPCSWQDDCGMYPGGSGQRVLNTSFSKTLACQKLLSHSR